MTKVYTLRKLPFQQLIILSICRFAEPVALNSVYPYLPEMIESFDIPKNDVAKWVGITSAVFYLSQAATGFVWGRASDRFGRKPVQLVDMICIMSTSLIFGFSRSLVWVVIARSLAGASCGNVGTIRTMVAEMVPFKELQPRAFSIMPLVWTIGSSVGPGLGGALANPAAKYPKSYGDSVLFKKYPFALPNIVAANFFLVGLSVGFLFLKETLETKKDKDYGRHIGHLLIRTFTQKRAKPKWPLEEEQESPLLQHSRVSSIASDTNSIKPQKVCKTIPPTPPTYQEIFSSQSNLNLLTYTLLALHSMAFDQLLPIFMHYPPQTDRSSNPNTHLPFKFTGGFGINSDRIGLLFTIYGIVGMFIQFFAFPPIARRYGVLPCLKAVTVIFPLVYLITPFTALLPTPTTQQIAILVIMLFKCWAAKFSFPCTSVLLTNSAVSLRILGTLNGVATSISALGRAAGPMIGGWTFSTGVEKGYGLLPWWILAGFALLGAIAPWWLVEMEGFGDVDENGIEDEEGEAIIMYGDGAEESLQAVLIGGGSPAENGEENDELLIEAPIDSQNPS